MPHSPRSARGRVDWLQVLLPLTIIPLLFAYFLLPLDVFGPARPALSWSVFAAALVLLSGLLLRQIRNVMVRPERGHPGLSILVLIFLSLVIFSAAYLALASEPGQFVGLHTRLDALYFTVVTVSTVGFGDITASGQVARAVVTVQIGYNLVFLATAVSTLSGQFRGRVADRVQHRHRPGGPPDDSPDDPPDQQRQR